jgi:hypothetical protein
MYNGQKNTNTNTTTIPPPPKKKITVKKHACIMYFLHRDKKKLLSLGHNKNPMVWPVILGNCTLKR